MAVQRLMRNALVRDTAEKRESVEIGIMCVHLGKVVTRASNLYFRVRATHLVDNASLQVRACMLASQRGRIPLRTVINSMWQLISGLPPTCNAIISFALSMHVCHYTYPVGYNIIYSIFRSHTMILAFNEQFFGGGTGR